ncbi:MAG TPA: hypothetical protein VK509_22920 [Polyangiales bacterium]|nr:hypothetical protein [Polyangiales bacterium]
MEQRFDLARSIGWMLLSTAVLVAACADDQPAARPPVQPNGANPSPAIGGPAGAAGASALPMGGLPGATLAGAPAINPIGSGTAGAAAGAPPASGTPMPCNIASSVKTNCQMCHGTTPIGGAPMSLLSWDDFQRDYVVKTSKGMIGQTKKMHELARIRLNDGANPMPPSGSLTVPADRKLLDDWLAGGAKAGGAQDASCAQQMPTQPGAMMGTTGGTMEYDFEPPTPTLPGEQCFELVMHGGQTPTDKTKYTVAAREYYMQFYFKAPWPANWVGTKAGGRYDALEVLHHWLLFTTSRPLSADGTHEEVIGTQLGDTAQLIQGWAIGGATAKMPEGVGFELPPPNSMLNLQWHYFNSTGSPQPDATAVIVCAVPKESLPNTASMTWLGTENITVPAGRGGTATGSCVNDSNGPIHIIQFVPHMHNIGRNMKSVIKRKSGMMEEVFNKPFANNSQLQYDVDVTLEQGETIISTCSFQNDGARSVGFGTSTTQEMCYQFAVSYPAHALDNGVISLIGASNTCWQFGE